MKILRHYYTEFGDLHLEVVKSLLEERYKVDIELTKPKVAFRETIRKNSDC
nr:hypothetical protein [Lachnobacterium bovis]